MRFPSADRYNEAVQNPGLYFSDPEAKRRRVQTDALGLPEVLSGGFAFTYRFGGAGGDIAVRCFHREIPELFERYRSISAFLASLRSRFFVDFAFAERGVRVDGVELPVVRMRWVEGETLLGYIARRRSEPGALADLRTQLLAFAEEAEGRGYAHGDVQHRNLMVAADGALKLVDYDGMYVPALRHLKSADAGHPHFQPPSRAAGDFGPRMDRFALAVIDLSLEALQEMPGLFDHFHRGENLILSRDDFLNPAASPVLNAIARVPRLVGKVAAFSDLCGLPASEMPPLREFRGGAAPGAAGAMPRPSKGASGRQTYTSPFDVVDGMNYSHTASFIGRPVELVGRVLQVVELRDKGLVLLRFGTKYTATPVVVMPLAVYHRWAGAPKMRHQPWMSVTGVLQTHRSGRFSTVQVLVKEASDVELLAGKDEVDFRLGRTTRSAPSAPTSAPASRPVGAQPHVAPVQPQPGTSPGPWKITRGATPDAPSWIGGPSSQQQARTPPPIPPSPTLRVLCPVCDRESSMPASARYHQCVHCGVAAEAARWRSAKPAPTPTQQPPKPVPRPAPSPTSAPAPGAGSSNPWQATPASHAGSAAGASGPPPKQGGLLSRLAKLLFGRTGA